MENLLEFKPKCIFLSGGAGFIGSHVLDTAVDAFPDCQFVVLDIMDPTCATLKNIEKPLATGRCKLVVGSIESYDLVRHLFSEHQFDSVIHLAALTHVDLSLVNSLDFTRVNVTGTHVLLECMREYNSRCNKNGAKPLQKIIIISTDEVVAHDVDIPLKEDCTFRCSNPYASSKCGAEILSQSYRLSFGLNIIVTRGNNVLGTRQSLNKACPKFITCALQDKPITIHGDGMQRRSFMDVQDTADALICLLRFGQVGHIYNIGTEREYTVLELAKLILHRLGKDQSLIVHCVDRAIQDRRYLIDSSKLRSLGWAPKRPIEDHIGEYISWYRQNYANYWDVNISPMLEAHPRV